MALAITIGGIDRTPYCRFESMEVTSTILANTDICSLVVSVYDGSWRPKAGNEIIVTNGASKEFGGMIARVSEEMVNPSHFRYRLTGRDYLQLFDRRLVVANYPAQLGSTTVAQVVTDFTTGFTTTNVQVSSAVGEQIYDYQPVSDVIRGLADTLGWAWYIDYDKDVHFYSSAGAAAPVASINFDTNTADYGDFLLDEDVSQEKNRVYLKGYKSKSTVSYSRNFTGDGSTGFFLLGYEPSSLDDMTITRAGITQTLHTDSVDGSPGDGTGGANDVYVCFTNMGIRWNTAPANGNAIAASFNYLFDGISVYEDPAAQAEMASREGGDGIHEYVVSDPGLTDSSAVDRGGALLSRFAWPRITGSFHSFTQGWRAGQSFLGTSTKRLGGFTDKRFYVHEVRKRLVSHPAGGSPTFMYDVLVADSAVGQ